MDITKKAKLPVENKLAVSVCEAAELIGVGKTTVYSLIEQKKFPYVRIGDKRIIVPVAGLQEWLKKQSGAGHE